ncbi:type IV secretion system protein [Bordetella trematum]|uniref:type IV secretion system protein n=1 Tax=Bordetella trematum TaxID=123899 RepID=UPI003F5229DB
MRRIRLLAAKSAMAVAIATGFITTPAYAGIPVIDGGNLVQNIMSAMEAVAQTAKQIEQYQTQLQQYENMLQNTMAPRCVYLGSGTDHHRPADRRAEHAGLLRKPAWQPGSLSVQVPGYCLLP